MQELIESLAAALRAGPPVRLAVLFGSWAAGMPRADSDVDIGILPGDGPPHPDELALQSALTLAVGREVNLVRLDRASTLLRWQVARTGIPIVCARPEEFSRFRARAAAEYIEFAPAFETYGELFRRRLAGAGGHP